MSTLKRAEKVESLTSVGRQIRHNRPNLLAVAYNVSRAMLEIDVELQTTPPRLVAVEVSCLVNGLMEIEGFVERNLVAAL